jgi:hypothetical protein
VYKLDTDNLKAITTAPNEPALNYDEQARLSRSKSSLTKMKGAAGLAASALLATTLMLSACGQEDDCIPSTPPTTGASNVGSFGTPVASSSQPSAPGSSQFTSGQTAATSGQTYCRSRRTGAFYWYTGSRYYSGGSSSSSSSSS